jgi:glucose-6-phosphate-specific signal transduction histidine kinase
MDPIAKGLIFIGIALILVGLAWQFGWIQAIRLGRLPGDILIERENSRFYFPLTTSILISLILSALMWLFRR